MGVPQFFRFLKRRYPEALAREIAGKVSSLAFDMNGFFYRAAEKVYGYGDGTRDNKKIPDYKKRQREKEIAKLDPHLLRRMLFDAILTNIKDVLMQVNPQDTVIFAIDGMVPMAKIQQQRQRRYKSAFEKKSKFFDTNAFSPGTELMVELDEYLREHLNIDIEKGKIGEGLWLPPKVIYSSHLVPGEGEHKIMDFYRKGLPEGPIAAKGGSHIIYGMDADLIMLSMLLPQERVFLMREDLTDIVNIEHLRENVQKDLGTETAIDDFLALMYLIGNDFLPRIKTTSNFDFVLPKVIDTYKKVGKSITSNGGKEINWLGLAHFLYHLRTLEPGFAQELSKTKYVHKSFVMDNAVKDGTLDFKEFRNGWYDYALGVPINSQDLLKTFAIPPSLAGPTTQQITEMSVEFLTGMAWTSLYYRKGMAAINREWSYPYFYAPLLTDLAIIAGQVAKKRQKIKQYKAFDTMLEYNVVHQLLCIIPPKSNHLLPKEVLPFYYAQSPIIDQFPNTFLFDEDGKNEKWQMHALVPHANIQRIYVVTEFVTFTRKTIKELDPQEDFMYATRGFGDPRKTIVQIRRTSDQICTGIKPSLGQWGRQTLAPRQEPPSKVIITRNQVQMRPDTFVKLQDPTLRPLEERKITGDVKLVRFRPRGQLWRVRRSKQKSAPKKSAIELLAQFDMDYSQVPIIFE
uniref:XRN 5'-3' exonuclease n=1 Tax=Pithovirus LCPAC304 TaxID=2506594 RepID=A0A481Z9K9_9VIRU|nr:MAG: XRN 5'-3' exonuclease [Pithovirus LCPAC304]